MEKRKVITRRGRCLRGFFPSAKTGQNIPWESPLELDALFLFEFSPGVRSYAEYQQKEIYYDEDGTQKKCYPDYLLELTDGSTALVEIKPTAKLRRTPTRRKYERIAAHFRAQGRPYLILTDDEIRRSPRLDNLKVLAYHAGRADEPGILSNVADFLSVANVTTLHEAEDLVGIQVVAELIREGLVACPWDEPLGPSWTINANKEGRCHDALLF